MKRMKLCSVKIGEIEDETEREKRTIREGERERERGEREILQKYDWTKSNRCVELETDEKC